MRKSSKKPILVLALLMSFTLIFTGCSKSNTQVANTNDVSKLDKVELKMYILGDKPKDFDKVYAEVNKIMSKKINATLNVQFISWADKDTKYPLLFSSGDNFDLAFTATGWCFYNQIATNKGFYELSNDFIQKYAPQTWKNEPKTAWDQAKVNGKVYMVPNDQNEYNYSLFAIRGDLREKYKIPEIKSIDGLKKYYDAIAKNEKAIVPLANAAGGQDLQSPYLMDGKEISYVSGTPLPTIGYNIKDKSGKVFAFVDTPEYKDYVVKMREYANNSYWSKTNGSNNGTRDEAFKAGTAASMVWNLNTVAKSVQEVNRIHPAWKAEVVDVFQGSKKLINTYTNNGMAINAKSKNPERAMMAIDLLRYDREIYDLTSYGIKGTHWEPVGDSMYTVLDATSNFPAGNVCPWGWHTNINRMDIYQPKAVKSFSDKWSSSDIVHNPLETFNFDDSKVKNEVAAVGKVITQFGVPLDLGKVDPTTGIDTYKKELKKAGLYKVLAEVQKQTNDFIKNSK
ncbi:MULTISPECIES: DUF3502 domain-containing protein [Clostridium]|uniref:DUF3502 domain-containing protein n=1 Tax=Clostridium frigoriphilum TaxID=443253 RepID=A0ABU7UKB1_9CLOT|nr:DUF3502 domain-containing protein [Clostridium sp. DSM 17811]MBU3099797.1 DUF3502 domain-containing protein [Clostridium sp. DSM 17811]